VQRALTKKRKEHTAKTEPIVLSEFQVSLLNQAQTVGEGGLNREFHHNQPGKTKAKLRSNRGREGL